MHKRSFSILSAICLALILFVVPVSGEEWVEVIDFEDVELGKWPGGFWVIMVDSTQLVAVAEDPADANNKVLWLCDDDINQSRIQAWYYFSQVAYDTLSIEYRIMFDREDPYAWNNGNTISYTGVEVRGANSTVAAVVGLEWAEDDQVLGYKEGSIGRTLERIELGQWYTVKIVLTGISSGNTNVEYYIDGQLYPEASGVFAGKNPGYLDNIRIVTSLTRACEVYFDDIVIRGK